MKVSMGPVVLSIYQFCLEDICHLCRDIVFPRGLVFGSFRICPPMYMIDFICSILPISFTVDCD